MTRWFGTDGIRGRVNTKPLVPSFILRLGQALGECWDGDTGPVVIGGDGRVSGDMVQQSLSAGLLSKGMEVARAGVVSTPALSYLTRENECAGGVMISASHNEFSDNGIKCFQSSGEKVTEQQEAQIETILEQGVGDLTEGADIGSSRDVPIGVADYVDELAGEVRFSGHVVVDCANGGASGLVSRVLSDRVDELTVINDSPDGTNINQNCGSLHPETVSSAVREQEADVGFALDGDGDRVIAVDGSGEVVNGDVLLYMLGSSRGRTDGGVVITVMSNLGLRKALEREGVEHEVVGVGDRNVYREMVQRGWRFGGEQSGHLIDRDWLPTGDGLRTLVSVLSILEGSGRSLSEWGHKIEVYPQVLHNITVDAKPELDQLEETNRAIDRVDDELGDEGRILVRYSGTEPVARVMLEGPDERHLNELAESIGDVMSEEINRTEVTERD